MCEQIAQPHVHVKAHINVDCHECGIPIHIGEDIIILHTDHMIVHEFHKDEEV